MAFSGGKTTEACSPISTETNLGKVGDVSLCAMSFHLLNTFIKPFCHTLCLLGTSNSVSIILHVLHLRLSFLFHPSCIHSLYMQAPSHSHSWAPRQLCQHLSYCRHWGIRMSQCWCHNVLMPSYAAEPWALARGHLCCQSHHSVLRGIPKWQ